MANIKSKKKRILTNKKAKDANKSLKSKVKTGIKKANESKKKEDISNAIKLIDKAQSSGVYHKNKAARMKSKIDKLNNNK